MTKIKRRLCTRDGGIILEEVEVSLLPQDNNVAVFHDKALKGWLLIDISTGLSFGSARTKKELFKRFEDVKIRYELTRKSQVYQKRVKEFEELSKV